MAGFLKPIHGKHVGGGQTAGKRNDFRLLRHLQKLADCGALDAQRALRVPRFPERGHGILLAPSHILTFDAVTRKRASEYNFRVQGSGFRVQGSGLKLETALQSSPTSSGSTDTCTWGCAYVPFSCASTTAIAATFTTSSTVAVRCKTCTGRLIPIRIGPISSPPPIFAASLQAILAEARSGKISTLAPPFKALKG